MALLLRMFPQRFWYKYLCIIPKALFLCNCRGLSSTEGWNVILKHLLKGEAWFDRLFLNRSTSSEVSNRYITQTQGVQINCSLPASCIIERQDATPARPSRLGCHLCSGSPFCLATNLLCQSWQDTRDPLWRSACIIFANRFWWLSPQRASLELYSCHESLWLRFSAIAYTNRFYSSCSRRKNSL